MTTVKKKTKPRKEINPDDVEKLAEVCDTEEQIAVSLGVSYTTYYERKKEKPQEFETAIKRGRSRADKIVYGKLIEAIKKGNITATIFYLKCKCGWKETQVNEVTGKDGKPLLPIINVVFDDDVTNNESSA